jgi:hypothetical protein
VGAAERAQPAVAALAAAAPRLAQEDGERDCAGGGQLGEPYADVQGVAEARRRGGVGRHGGAA